MRTILIVGAAGGTGLALARHYAGTGQAVIAANARPFRPTDFAALSGVSELRYDPLDDASAADLALRLGGRRLDMVIFAALRDGTGDAGLADLDGAAFERDMLENCWAPLHLAALLEPQLRLAPRPVIAALTDGAADTGRDATTSRYGWRASQAALWQMWRNLAVEWRDWGALPLMLDPGDLPAAALAARLDAAGPAEAGALLRPEPVTV